MFGSHSACLGAVLLAAGVSLAGPHAIAVATADDRGADTSTVSPGPAAGAGGSRRGPNTDRPPVRRVPRVPSAAAAAPSPHRTSGGESRGSTASTPRPAAATGLPTRPSATALPVDRPAIAAPSASVPVRAVALVRASAAVAAPESAALPLSIAPALVPVAASASAAVAGSRLPSSGLTARQSLTNIEATLEQFLDNIGRALSGLPSGPVTDALGGVLWLVRRTVFPVGADVGLWGSVACVATKDCSGRDLTGSDLTGRYLGDVTFTNSILSRALLTNADLTAGKLNGAKLIGAKLTGARLASADFSDASLNGALLDRAFLDHTDFSGADLRNAALAGIADAGLVSADLTFANLSGQDISLRDLRGIKVNGADLSGANLSRSLLQKADLAGANLKSATLQGANLSTADLTGANLTGANLAQVGSYQDPGAYVTDLRDANLTNAVFDSADLTRSRLDGAKLTSTVLTKANLRGARLDGISDADMVSATWTGANLSGQKLNAIGRNLSGINWTGVNLTGANLAWVNLTGAVLAGADLTDAVLAQAQGDLYPGANMTGADLRGAILGVSDADLLRVILNGANLSGQNLSLRTLNGIKLAGANLTGVNLSGTRLDQADLSGADFSGAVLAGVRLAGAKIAGADLRGVDLRTTILAGLSDAELASADLRGTKLSGLDLSGRKLSGIRLAGADLRNTILSGTDLSAADLASADLGGANLAGANLRDVDLHEANLVSATLDGATNFGTAILSGANLSRQALIRLDLSGHDLTGTNFSGAILTGTNFSGALLSQANLRDTKLIGADLSGAALTRADVYSADLRYADLSSATGLRSVLNFETTRLAGADLSRTDLRGMPFIGDFTGASFEDALLRFAQFTQADLADVSFLRADLADATFDQVRWRNTTCPDGSKSDTGCSSAVTTSVRGDAPARLVSVNVVADPNSTRIESNQDFNYADALVASRFSELAYEWRDDAEFSKRVEASGWQGISVNKDAMDSQGFSPTAGGYGVNKGTQDGILVQSFAFAGKRAAADGTVQFVFAVEGSNSPATDREDWVANVGAYGWSRYAASLQPLMAEVIHQMIAAQQSGAETQLILTGHSLGGATAMMTYADLLAPQGNLWPGESQVLAAGERIWDRVGDWTPATRKAITDATTVYTFGAPSPLIDAQKMNADAAQIWVNTALEAASRLDPGAAIIAAGQILAGSVMSLGPVDDARLPAVFRTDQDAVAKSRIFQFEHTPGYQAFVFVFRRYDMAGDIVAEIGSRDPGTLVQFTLDPSLQWAYAGELELTQVPGITHPIGDYVESVTRVVTNRWVIASDQQSGTTSPLLPRTPDGQGGDARNDFFLDRSDDGKGGNDLFVFTKPGSYQPIGGAGDDIYTINDYGVNLTLNGGRTSGRDTVVFNLSNQPVKTSVDVRPGEGVNVTLAVGGGSSSSSATILNWDERGLDVYRLGPGVGNLPAIGLVGPAS